MATTPFRVSQGDGTPAPTTWINILSMCKTHDIPSLILYFTNVHTSITYMRHSRIHSHINDPHRLAPAGTAFTSFVR